MRAFRIAVALAVFVLAASATAEEVLIHFEDMQPGEDVAGLGTLHPSLDLQPMDPLETLSVIQTFYIVNPKDPDSRKLVVYRAPNRGAWDMWSTNDSLEDEYGRIVDAHRGDFVEGMTANGFANTDCSKQNPGDTYFCPQQYAITFGNRRVFKFKMLMVDFGDFNPMRDTFHQVSLRGFENGAEVAVPYVIEYTTKPVAVPRWCSLGFDPKVEADACDCDESGLGHIHMEVHAPPGSSGLDRIEMRMSEVGFDPNTAYDSLRIGFVNLFDLHPVSCPNPLNQGGKGNLPAAVLGTGEFDVTNVDPSTCRLEGVPAHKWAYEDVSRPYVGELVDPMSCTSEGPDGYMDLTLKFDNQLLSEALNDLPVGSVWTLELVCLLHSGEEFRSEDIIKIVD